MSQSDPLTALREHAGAVLALSHDVRGQIVRAEVQSAVHRDAYEALRAACIEVVDALDAYLDDSSLYPDQVLLLIQAKIEPLVKQQTAPRCQLGCKADGPPGPIWCSVCGHDPKCCKCEE